MSKIKLFNIILLLSQTIYTDFLNNGEHGQSHQTGMHTNTWLNNVLQHREVKWYFTEEN
jgi:hypothetical protein